MSEDLKRIPVATAQLPALQKAVAATNAAYKQYTREEEAAREHREDTWRQERKEVDAMGTSLRCDQFSD